MDEQFHGRTDDDLFYDDVEPVVSAAVIVEEKQQQEEAPAPPRNMSSSIFADPSVASRPPRETVVSDVSSSSARQQKPPRTPSRNTAANAEARLMSGSNPRQKLTDEELAAKMEKMKLLAAEQTRKFQMAEQDERQHAASYARGMEEARRRRAEEAVRRRRADEDRRKLDDERARNRERKLKAMSLKDGGWDEGKTAVTEGEDRRGFKSAHGGVRGIKGAASAAFSRPRQGGDAADRPDVDRFLEDRRFGGRGSGHHPPRASAHPSSSQGKDVAASNPQTVNATAPALTIDEFPALPPGASDGRKIDTMTAKASVIPPLPTPPAGSKWDDEMEALDSRRDSS
ncbi:hypothetical protein XA68_13982 [Ophiocordyceps unilateralis]|uniref:Uncharacterized protein n=1 Tax=Ophiocordyceps unilateralis TaxID=268505 RepID=A0A2A9PA07_OPHUN|nr:hypothetical protein XA68_13982 [Ophiocordyceps unilateralis]